MDIEYIDSNEYNVYEDLFRDIGIAPIHFEFFHIILLYQVIFVFNNGLY